MQLLTYLFFVITTLVYLGIVVLNLSNPTMTGNDSMGYGLLLLFLELGFTGSSLSLTALIYAKGGFDWVAQHTSTRLPLLILTCLLMALTTFFCSLFKWEWHDDRGYPHFLRWIASGHGELWIPLLWLVACFLSVKPSWQSTVPLQAVKIPFWIGVSVSALFSGGLLVGFMRDLAQQAVVERTIRIDDAKRRHQQHLDEIAAHKSDDSILGLLAFTTRYQEEDVRQAALAKIKSHPDWEAQLLRWLANKYYYREVYSFLGSNRLAHPDAFVQPLNQSLVRLSADIKAEIESSNNLQDWSFDSYGIANLLQAIDEQFGEQLSTFYPNVLTLKQALTTPPPERFKGTRFAVTKVVNSWLEAHQK